MNKKFTAEDHNCFQQDMIEGHQRHLLLEELSFRSLNEQNNQKCFRQKTPIHLNQSREPNELRSNCIPFRFPKVIIVILKHMLTRST